MKCHPVQRQSSQRFTRGEQISEEKARTQKSCPQIAPKLPVVSFKHARFFCLFEGFGFFALLCFFVFWSWERQRWREEMVMSPRSPLLWALPWSNRTQSPDVLGGRLVLWHSRPRCHGDLKQGPGASSPLTPWGRRPGVWSSAVFPHPPPEQWRPGLRGLLWPGGPWGPCPWHTLALPWRPFKQMPCKALCLTHDLYVKP